MVQRLEATYNAGLPSTHIWNPAGFAPTPSDTTDDCIDIANGVGTPRRDRDDPLGKTPTLASCTAS